MLDNLTIDDIADEGQKIIAQLIGIEAYISLVKYYGGTSIYIFKSDSLVRDIRDKKIKQEFNGYNYVFLAKKYNLTENSIRVILSNKKDIDGQIKFEF